MTRIRRLTGGRAWVARLSGLLALATIVALIVAVLPVQAGAGGATTGGVQPYEISLGGQPGDCDATVTELSGLLDDGGNGPGYPGLPSPAVNSFRIVNLSDGVAVGGGWFQHTDTAGAGMVIEVNPNQGGKTFDFRVVSGGSIADVIVNGGSNSTHFVYSRDAGHASTDFDLHAPTKSRGGSFTTSHAEFCYDIFATISGTKWHDNDQDGDIGDGNPTTEPVESVLGGWTINVYDSGGPVATDTTDGSGFYSFTLPLGETYTVCEARDDLLDQWAQSNVGGTWTTTGVCGNDLGGGLIEEPDGHVINNLQADADADFGNFMTVTISCGDDPVTLGGNTIVFPPNTDNPLTEPIEGLCNKDTEEYVFESYTLPNGDQVVDFHPIDGSTGGKKAKITEALVWSIDNTQNSLTLFYDDDLGAGEQTALFCNHDPRLDPANDPLELDPNNVSGVLPAGDPAHTTCIIERIENAGGANGTRTDILYSEIDGRRFAR